MRCNFRTAFKISLLLVFVFVTVSESKVIHKAKLVKVVRRESVPEKSRLADGTLFERHIEKGEVPPLPIEEEEEADDLNDPRIGHLDKAGGIAVPVDSDGKVLKGFEYLLKPITIDLEDEDDANGSSVGDKFQMGNVPQNGESKDYKPYPNNQDMRPKEEFLPAEQETGGEEYDDVASEPREPLPNVPGLPKPDYTDSGESDEDLKGGAGDADQDIDRERDDSDRPVIINEVIIPSSNIDLPISRDDVDEISKSADEVEKETEIERDGDEIGGGDKNVDIPKNRVVGDSEIDDSKGLGRFEEDGEVIDSGRDENEIDLSEADVEEIAKDFGKGVFENVMSRTKEFDEMPFELNSNDRDEDIDPNSINAQSEIPSEPENPREQVSEAEDLDGVILPDQYLTDEEIARIAAESLKPAEPVVPEVVPPRPPVRGGRIGSGVQPDSASQHNFFIQFFLVSFVMLLL